MDDLISRQSTIDALGEEPEVWTGNDEYAQGLNNQWWHDVAAIKAVPSAQPEPHWIPCSERLPEHNQICIVTDDTRTGTYEYGFHTETYDKENGWTYLGHKIIAWMPLQKPYQEEGDDPDEQTD